MYTAAIFQSSMTLVCFPRGRWLNGTLIIVRSKGLMILDRTSTNTTSKTTQWTTRCRGAIILHRPRQFQNDSLGLSSLFGGNMVDFFPLLFLLMFYMTPTKNTHLGLQILNLTTQLLIFVHQTDVAADGIITCCRL
mmetsp:Transcript_112438/g.314170  ORF Transcript_112438/g.314170 Transcript_112438/m.314170 type:complete len:136 (-) Transcript_112438:194-601(-)